MGPPLAPAVIAKTTVPGHSGAIYANESTLLLDVVHGIYLYQADLQGSWELPLRVLAHGFPRSRVFGGSAGDRWKIFHVGGGTRPAAEGAGELLSVSDWAIAYRLGDAIRIESGGRSLGSITVGAAVMPSGIAELAGANRIYLNFGPGGPRIADFTGKPLLNVRPPPGWGFRHGWNQDGSRLLFDNFVRTVPFLTGLVESVLHALGAPEEANSEIVRVINADDGKVCLDVVSPTLLGREGSYHADLSPSGRLIVVSSPSQLELYRLPDLCTGP